MEDIDSGWDRYCSTAAGSRLMRIAATLWELAGSKSHESEPVRYALERSARRINKAAFSDMSEDDFASTLQSIDMATADIATAVVDVRRCARSLRGQLSLPTVNP